MIKRRQANRLLQGYLFTVRVAGAAVLGCSYAVRQPEILVCRNRDVDQFRFRQVQLVHQLDEILPAAIGKPAVILSFPAYARY